LVDTGDRLGQDGLAGTVVSAQRGYLSRREIKVDAEQRLDSTEVLAYASQPEKRLGSISRT
jgi:hypothetical protein